MEKHISDWNRMNIPKGFDGQTRQIDFGVLLHLSDDATAVQFEKKIPLFHAREFPNRSQTDGALLLFSHCSGTLGLLPDIRTKAQIQRLSPPVAEVVIEN